MTYTLGSLFSGIGGIDLAFSREGFDIRWQVEIDPFCRQILAKHSDRWPNAEVHEDVHGVGKHNLSAVDVMAGGFPCQDISNSGKKIGLKEGTRSGLWFQFARIIGELRPRIVFLENVAVITSRGGAIVAAGLTELGYDAEWGVVPASVAGAAHRRARWWCVAYDNRVGWWGNAGSGQGREPFLERRSLADAAIVDTRLRFGMGESSIQNEHGRASPADSGSVMVYAERNRLEGRLPSDLGERQKETGSTGLSGQAGVGQGDSQSKGLESIIDEPSFPRLTSAGSWRGSEPILGRAVDGLSGRLDSATLIAGPGEEQYSWEAPRTIGYRSPRRPQRLKALGNAVYVPLVQVFAAAIRQELEASNRLPD